MLDIYLIIPSTLDVTDASLLRWKLWRPGVGTALHTCRRTVAAIPLFEAGITLRWTCQICAAPPSTKSSIPLT